MLYVPIKIYSNERSVRGCVVLAAIFLGLAVAGFLHIDAIDVKVAVIGFCCVGFCINCLSVVAAATKQPMLKVLDDRFSVYTPFGYAMIRFGEVLAFRQGGLPGMRSLRVEINKSARARFPSSLGKLLYSLVWLNFTNSVGIQSYMLGADLSSVIRMLEKRRLAAIRLDAIDDYDPTALTQAG